jgi:signal transduction histidine kinase
VAARALVDDAIAAFRAAAAEAGVALVAEVAPGLPELSVDRVRIGEVLSNLLSNALRHSPAGATVIVRAERAPGGGIAIAVEDSGPGIPSEDRPFVFDRFRKSADSQGMGLGLAIAKTLVEAHHGTIEAETRPAGGTTLRLTLPSTSDS